MPLVIMGLICILLLNIPSSRTANVTTAVSEMIGSTNKSTIH